MTARRFAAALLGLALLSPLVVSSAAAGVSRLTVESRQDVLGGRSFGAGGSYEKLAGIVEFALDPANAANASIVDLAGAPRDASGRVTASANFMVLRPKAMPRRRAVALLEVGNRGGKAVLPYFARAAWSTNPTAEAELGDTLPLRLGLTLIWASTARSSRSHATGPNASGAVIHARACSSATVTARSMWSWSGVRPRRSCDPGFCSPRTRRAPWNRRSDAGAG